MAQGSLTARQTCRAGAKAGHSDPAVKRGIAVAQRIKGTPGITGLSFPRVHIDGRVWHLNIWGEPAEMLVKHRLITGKPYRRESGVIPWEVSSSELDPVTTEAKNGRGGDHSHECEIECEIYGHHNTPTPRSKTSRVKR